jgi:hypothetical protein
MLEPYQEATVKTAILYAREIEGQSLQEQLDACRRYAAAQGLVAVAAVVDLQTSGPAYRLGLRGALDMVGAGDVPVLIAVSAAHLSKDPVRLQALQEMLQGKNCEIHYAGGEQ